MNSQIHFLQNHCLQANNLQPHKLRMTLAVTVTCLLLALFAFSNQVYAGVAKDKLFVFYKDVSSMSATFKQTTLDSRFKAVAESSGKLTMQRPGKFRWDYLSPYEQVIVADGKKLWVYDKDLEQVTVNRLDTAIGNTPALLLSGNEPLELSFKIVELDKKTAGLDWVELFPKETESSFTSMRLAFSANHLEYMELVDSFGQTTQLKFSNTENNPEINVNLFNFTPPIGVDVIGEE
ncbi:MAG: outer membrane lipoprotein chaperone LolA [Gammaproteobacteria bacterium]|nr:outer membrane lipoprotein chaperone LolA [Gammaproteobacteria bacterium]